MLGDGLIDLHRQGELVIVWRFLHLVQQILSLAEELALHLLLGDVVEGEGYLLILIILIIVVIGEVGLLLGGDDTAHEFHGWVLLALVLALLGLDHHLGESLAVVLEFYLQEVELLIDLHGLRLIAQSAHGEHPVWVLVDGKLTFPIA